MSENDYQKQLADANASMQKIKERAEILKADSKTLQTVNEQYKKAKESAMNQMKRYGKKQDENEINGSGKRPVNS